MVMISLPYCIRELCFFMCSLIKCRLYFSIYSGALKEKTIVIALFVMLQFMLTLLIAFQSLSLFLLLRFGQLVAALVLRSALFQLQVKLIPFSIAPPELRAGSHHGHKHAHLNFHPPLLIRS